MLDDAGAPVRAVAAGAAGEPAARLAARPCWLDARTREAVRASRRRAARRAAPSRPRATWPTSSTPRARRAGPRGWRMTHRGARATWSRWHAAGFGLSRGGPACCSSPSLLLRRRRCWEIFAPCWPRGGTAGRSGRRPRDAGACAELARGGRGSPADHFRAVAAAGAARRAGPRGRRRRAAHGRSRRASRCRGAARALLRRLAGAGCVNVYGPTETTIVVTACDAGRRTAARPRAAIGRPIAQHAALRARPAAASRCRSACRASCTSAARAWRAATCSRPELTAERFVPDPFAAEPGGRLYRTGDLAR